MEIASLSSEDTKRYDLLTSQAEKKIIANARFLNIDNCTLEGRNKYNMIYYDTPENLLTNAGILLYKTWEKGNHYFIVQRLNILPSTSKLRRNEVYRHKIDASDTPIMHSFYLINGIVSMFTTQFSIDLEYVIKNVKPIIIANVKAIYYKIFSGTGFKANLTFEDVVYINCINKRRRMNEELTVELLASQNFMTEFNKFTFLLEKYCKDILPKKESRFDYAKRVTEIQPKTVIDAKTTERKKKK